MEASFTARMSRSRDIDRAGSRAAFDTSAAGRTGWEWCLTGESFVSGFPYSRVAVTGGSGRLGRYVVRHLAPVCDVAVIDIEAGDGEACLCDVRDIDAVRGALRGCQAVVHLAALDDGVVDEEEAYVDVNLRGTWNVLQASEELGISRVVLASSVAALGIGADNPPVVLPLPVDTELVPRQAYGMTKKVVEEFARAFVDRGLLEVLALRPSLVAQPDITWSMAQTASEADGTEPPPAASGAGWRILREPLAITRAFVSPDDAARAFRAALEVRGIRSGSFYVTGPDTCSALKTADAIERTCGRRPAIGDADLYRRHPRASAFDLWPSREVLGWQPEDCWADHLARVIASAGTSS